LYHQKNILDKAHSLPASTAPARFGAGGVVLLFFLLNHNNNDNNGLFTLHMKWKSWSFSGDDGDLGQSGDDDTFSLHIYTATK